MGVSQSRDSSTKPVDIPPLPSLPKEVFDHCNSYGCELKSCSLSVPVPSNNKGTAKLEHREYMIHVPPLRSAPHSVKIPLVVCIHGTDETMHDTELLVQEDGSTTWLDLSHLDPFAVVFPQSLRYYAKDNVPVSWRPLGDNFRSCWEPDHNDELFLSHLLDELLKDYDFIDPCRLYCVGFSNGGLFLSSLLVNHGLDTRFTAVCNYMGGISPEQMRKDANLTINDEMTSWIDQPCVSLLGISSSTASRSSESNVNKPQSNGQKLPLENIFKNPVPPSSLDCERGVGKQATPPIYIVTGSSDSNRNYCYNALCAFKQLKYDVFFDDLKGIGHEYQSDTTKDIWTFFKQHYRD